MFLLLKFNYYVSDTKQINAEYTRGSEPTPVHRIIYHDRKHSYGPGNVQTLAGASKISIYQVIDRNKINTTNFTSSTYCETCAEHYQSSFLPFCTCQLFFTQLRSMKLTAIRPRKN